MYFVTYQPSSVQAGQVASVINTVNTTDSELVNVDFDPTTMYIFTVEVGTTGSKLQSSLVRSVNAEWFAVVYKSPGHVRTTCISSYCLM